MRSGWWIPAWCVAVLAPGCDGTMHQGTPVPPDAALAPDVAIDAPGPDKPPPTDLPPLPDLPPPSDAELADPCSLPPETGPCDGAFMRFFYRPATARCEAFSYGGCSGNANNFTSSRACDMACAHRADACERCLGGTCDQNLDCSLCPVNYGVNQEVCPLAGLHCYYGPACGASWCDCRPEDAGGLRWDCKTNLCR